MQVTGWEEIIRVPQVLQQCSLACGLKEMRLVNKTTSAGMIAFISGCKVVVNGADDLDQLAMLAMLKEARLSRLKVILKSGEPKSDEPPLENTSLLHRDTMSAVMTVPEQRNPTTVCPGPFLTSNLATGGNWVPHKRQMTSLLNIMGQTIQNVVFLDIKSCYSDGTVLQQLGPSLRNIKQLRVVGHISRDTLALLGRTCDTLQVIGSISGCESLEGLLPSLTHVQFIDSDDPFQFPTSAPGLATNALTRCMALTSYNLLTNMSIQGYGVTPAVWDALPAGLQHLDCVMSMPLSSSCQSLSQLCGLRLYRWDNIFGVSILTSYLLQVPGCQTLELVNQPGYVALSDCKAYVFADCQQASYEQLSLLDGLVANGLKVLPNGFNIHLSSPIDIPNLPSVNGLLLDCTSRNLSNPLIPATLSVQCPQLTSFGLLGLRDAASADLKNLVLCTSLQHVSLASVEDRDICRYETAGICELCTTLRSLQVFQLQWKSNPQATSELVAIMDEIQSVLIVSGSCALLQLYADPRVIELE